MNRYLLGTALATATMIASPAVAAPASATAPTNTAARNTAVIALPDSAASDFNGATEILRGDYAAAERVLARQLRMWPGDADLLLNLAFVYRNTGRTTEARTLYRAVLAHPNEAVDTQDRGSHSAHALARAALVTLDGTQLTAR